MSRVHVADRRGLRPYENINFKAIVIAARRAQKVLDDGWRMKSGGPAIRLEGPIPWDDADPARRSLVFYAHSWDMLDDLLLAHSETLDERWLHPAARVALEWIDRSPPAAAGAGGMAWYDMAVGRRAYRLAYLADAARRLQLLPDADIARMTASLEEHCAHLADDGHIAFHTNHGFYQVAGQLAMASRFRDVSATMRTAFAQAQERLSRMIAMQFTDEGVHKEHSPEYHLTVYSALQGIVHAGLVEDPATLARCAGIENALAWFVAPDQHLVGFGDTGERSVARKASEVIRKWQDPAMRFVASGGAVGAAPAESVRAFVDSGYYIARDRWPSGAEDFAGGAYLAVNAAFHSRTHKHADDQSFVWHDRGAPILVDAGRYGYVGKSEEGSALFEAGFWYTDPRRIYCETTRAHNTVEIDGRDLPRRDVEPWGSAIRRHGVTDDGLRWCETATTPFGDVRFERLLVFRPGEWLLVLDRLAAVDGAEHAYRSWFHFPPGSDVAARARTHRIRVPGVDVPLHALALRPVDDASVVVGDDGPPMQGFHSPRDMQFVPAPALGYELRAADAGFATLFAFGRRVRADAAGVDAGDREQFDLCWREGDDGGCHLRVHWPAGGAIRIDAAPPPPPSADAPVSRKAPARDSEMIDWKDTFRHYVANLAAAWPEGRSNQVDKLEKFLADAGEASGLTRAQLVEQTIEVAARRAANRPQTMFLISCGSSGSHWLEAMLADFPRYVACGEVYLPRDMIRDSFSWDPAGRAAFLDCVHLAHVPTGKEALERVNLINSAHLSGWIMSRMNGKPEQRVLLVRNPVDIVVSRTFRKNDYRQFSGRDATDEQYLQKNIDFVNTFYKTAAERGAEHVVKYEDLRQRGPETLAALMEAIGDPRPLDVLSAVAEKYSAENQTSNRLSNVYRGPATQLPEGLRESIAERIDPAVRTFGY